MGKAPPTEAKEIEKMNILTRKNLKALNVPDDAIDAIVEAHSDAINDIKQERDQYADTAKAIETLTAERDQLKKQLEEARKGSGDIATLQAEFDAYKQTIEQEKKASAIATATKKLLTDNGMRDKLADLVLSKHGLDGIELDDKGAIKDSDTLLASFKTDYGDLFAQEKPNGTPPATPPNGGNKPHGSGRAYALATKYHNEMYATKQEGE